MELTITGDLAKQILTASKKDGRLAEALARQYLGAIDPGAMAAFLLTHDVAMALLAERLKKDPVSTIRALQGLPERHGRAPRSATRRKAGRTTGGRRRKRLTSGEVEQLKAQVKTFLARRGWATRKQLTGAVALETQAIYRRIMGELQQAGDVVSRGEKSKAEYALKGGKKKRAKGRAKKKTSKTARKPATTTE